MRHALACFNVRTRGGIKPRFLGFIEGQIKKGFDFSHKDLSHKRRPA